MRTLLLTPLVLCLGAALSLPAQAPDPARAPLRVCATTPNLAALVREVAGPDLVEVQVFCRPSQDPHFLRALPSFVKQLHEADLLCAVGLDLEAGWLPALLDAARNPGVRPGSPGFFDASTAIRPLGVPTQGMDRSAGDVHVSGNPHYLVDPVSGALVADQLAARLGDLRPASRAAFEGRAAALRIRLGTLLFGAELAEAYDFTKLARLQQAGRLQEFLDSQGQRDRLGGVLRDFAAFRDAPVIADHDAWRYLTTQLGLRTIGFLEPRPGIPPSTSHLRELCDRAQVERPRALLHVAYFEPRAIDFVVEATGVRAVTLAHQVGALEGTGDYVAMVRENIARLAAALSAGTDSSGG